jgi:hypothetical protein
MADSKNMSYLNSLLLANIRSSYIKDSLNLYIIIPMGVIGTILNLITLIILSKKTFNDVNIYKIMKVYSLNSLLITFFISFIFLFSPYVLLELSKSIIGRIYICDLVNWFYLFFFIFGNCLDILLNLERALEYSNGYAKIKQFSPYLICFIILILCVIIHIPSDLAVLHTPDDELYVKLRLCYATTFATNSITKVILIVSYIIEGPFLMVLAVGSNILAYISYKSFMKRKQELIINNRERGIELTENETRKQAKTEKMNLKLLVMTIYLTIFSIISHLLQFGAQLIIFVFPSYFCLTVYVWSQYIYIFIIVLKHFCTIFFYYNFNLKFKRRLLSFFCKKFEINLLTNLPSNNIPLSSRNYI